VADFLEAPISSWAQRFWSAVQCGQDTALAVPTEARDVLCSSSAHIAAAIYQGHPWVADPQQSLAEQLVRLPPALHPAACSAAALAAGGTLSLQMDDTPQQAVHMLLVGIALPSSVGVRDIELDLSLGSDATGGELMLAALEDFLIAVEARPQLPVAKVALHDHHDNVPAEQAAHDARVQTGGAPWQVLAANG
jgi:hypothetical protein